MTFRSQFDACFNFGIPRERGFRNHQVDPFHHLGRAGDRRMTGKEDVFLKFPIFGLVGLQFRGRNPLRFSLEKAFEFGDDLIDALKTLFGSIAQTPLGDIRKMLRNVAVGGHLKRVGEPFQMHCLAVTFDRRTQKRDPQRQELIQNHAQRIDVHRGVRGLSSSPFGSDVIQCPGHFSRPREVFIERIVFLVVFDQHFSLPEEISKPPIEQKDLAIFSDDDVVGFKIAMDNALRVCVGDRFADGQKNPRQSENRGADRMFDFSFFLFFDTLL